MEVETGRLEMDEYGWELVHGMEDWEEGIYIIQGMSISYFVSIMKSHEQINLRKSFISLI